MTPSGRIIFEIISRVSNTSLTNNYANTNKNP